MFSQVIISVAVALVLAGCANPYRDSYKPEDDPLNTLPVTTPPEVRQSSGTLFDDQLAMYEHGYVAIGGSHFHGEAASESQALAEATDLHASYVVLWNRYTTTVSGVHVLETPTYSHASTSWYTDGYRNELSVEVTGTQTTLVPYSHDIYDQAAAYFAPLDHREFGVWAYPISEKGKEVMGLENGLFIFAVRQGSPADKAGLVHRDVIIALNDIPITDMDKFTQVTIPVLDKPTTIKYWHSGVVKTDPITINSNW